MTTQKKQRQPRTRSRIPRGASFSRPHASVTPIGYIRSLKNAKAIREWIGLSLSEMADEAGRILGDTFASAINKQKVDRWEKTERMPPKMRHVYGVMLATELSDQLGRKIGVTIKSNSPWHVTAWAWCKCGAPFELWRADLRRCPKCRAEE